MNTDLRYYATGAAFLFVSLFLLWSCAEMRLGTIFGKLVKRSEVTVKIGSGFWLTGESELGTIIQKASLENKLIMLVFCGNYSPICSVTRRNVFDKGEFSQILDRVLPVYISETNERVQRWLETFELHDLPVCLLLTQDGQPIETIKVEETLSGFLDHLERAEYRSRLEKYLEDKPHNYARLRELFELSKWPELQYAYKRTLNFETLIAAHPDPYDSFTQEVWEELVTDLFHQRYRLLPEKWPVFFQRANKSVFQAYTKYYPDKFKYSLTGAKAFTHLMRWLVDQNTFDPISSVYQTGLLVNAEQPVELMNLYRTYANILSDRRGVEQAFTVLKQMKISFSENKELWDSTDYVRQYFLNVFELLDTLADYDLAQSRNYAHLFFNDMIQVKIAGGFDEIVYHLLIPDLVQYTVDHDFLLLEVLTFIEKVMSESKDIHLIHLLDETALVINKLYGRAQARSFLKGSLSDYSILIRSGEQNKPYLWRTVSEALQKYRLSDEETLQIAEHSLDLNRFGGGREVSECLDVLAHMYADLDYPYEAVVLKREAMRLYFTTITPEYVRQRDLEDFRTGFCELLTQAGIPQLDPADQLLLQIQKCP